MSSDTFLIYIPVHIQVPVLNELFSSKHFSVREATLTYPTFYVSFVCVFYVLCALKSICKYYSIVKTSTNNFFIITAKFTFFLSLINSYWILTCPPEPCVGSRMFRFGSIISNTNLAFFVRLSSYFRNNSQACVLLFCISSWASLTEVRSFLAELLMSRHVYNKFLVLIAINYYLWPTLNCYHWCKQQSKQVVKSTKLWRSLIIITIIVQYISDNCPSWFSVLALKFC